MKKLTKEELGILCYLCKGYNNSDIAKEIYKSVHTIKIYVSVILRKLNAKNRTEAVFKVCQDEELMAWIMNEINNTQE